MVFAPTPKMTPSDWLASATGASFAPRYGEAMLQQRRNGLAEEIEPKGCEGTGYNGGGDKATVDCRKREAGLRAVIHGHGHRDILWV